MGVVTRVHHRHLTNLVDGEAVITVVIDGRYGEYRIQHLDKGLIATHQIDQSLRVVEYRPCVVPAVTLSEGIAPLERREW